MDGLAANLFSRYKRIMRGTFLGVLAIAGGLFYVQIHQASLAERALLENRLRENALALNFILKASASTVDSLKLATEDWYAIHPTAPDPPSPLYKQLTAKAEDGFFTLDQVPPPYNPALIGNLTATARKPGPVFRNEAEMALSLNGRFHTVGKLLPNAAWVYYTSGSGFINIYPWTESKSFRYTPELLTKEFYNRGRPEKNPGRDRFWTEAYVDEAGKGLMVTVAAPVYQQDSFRGTVAIDLTLDQLNNFVRTWKSPLGAVFIINDHDQLLAHPRLVTSKSSTVQNLTDALPESLRHDAAALMTAAGSHLIERDGWLVEALPLDQAPFRLVLVADKSALLLDILKGAGLTVFGLLAGLAATLMISSRITLTDFIRPSQRLVDFIGQESRGAATKIPEVPADWQPWFETIHDVFNDHTKLISIQNELDVARNMQQAILPTRFPNREDIQVFARMLPAKEVGGDFYDFFWLAPGLLGVVVADVSGKGVPAALFMAVARTLIRATALGADGPGACLKLVNNLLVEGNDTAMFVTVFYGILDTATGELIYGNAGHTPPCLVDAAGVVTMLPGTGGMALGVIEDISFAEATATLEPGSTVLFYTDGVTEAFDPEEHDFTEARLRQVLAGSQSLNVTSFVDQVVVAVETFAAGAPQADDLTCLALRFVRPEEEAASS